MERYKRKSKKKLILALMVCSVIIIISAVSYFLLFQGKKDKIGPDVVLEKYIGYLNKNDYESMYEMLDSQSHINISKSDFIDRNQNIYEGIEAKNVVLTIQNIKEINKSEQVITYDVTMDTVAGELEYSNHTTLSKDKEKGYMIKWDHQMIYPRLEESDKVRVSKTEAKRGKILDRNDIMLAGPGMASSVGLVPGKMKKQSQQDIQKLADLLGISAESIQKKLAAEWVKDESLVPIKIIEKIESISMNGDQNALEESIQLQENLLEIKGVMISDAEVRTYPLKESASHLTGYVQNITVEELEENKGKGYNDNSVIGKNGLEKLYEDQLRGTNGCKIEIVTSKGEAKEILASIPKSDGKDVKLTIDTKLQKVLYEEFKEDKSCNTVINPKTGEVLALVSTPAFDPNDFVMGLSDEKWKSLNEDKNKPLWNRFRATWCPGSTLKPAIAAIGVSTGKINPNENFGDEGLSWQKDESWGNYYVTTLHDYEYKNMQNAIIYSDNIYFAKAALKIGEKELVKQFNNMGFHEEIPFDIEIASSQYSNDKEIKGEVQLADSGYGQGQVLVNPLHLASIYSAFSNDGNMITPYLKYEEKSKPKYWKENVFTKESVDLVNKALVQVIEDPHGSGRTGKIDGVALAGKTGTAELKATKEDKKGIELGWFAVFAPGGKADDTLLLISMVEDVKDRGGSTYVVKKDKQVLEQIIAH